MLGLDHLTPHFRNRHDIISLQIEWFVPSLPSSTITYRKLNSVPSENICAHLNSSDWTLFSVPEGQFNVQQGLSIFTVYLQKALDTIAPVSCLLMSKRDATHNKYDEVRLPSNFSSTA